MKHRFAAVGDVIETTFSDGRKAAYKITTPEQSAVANELIMSGRWTRQETTLDNDTQTDAAGLMKRRCGCGNTQTKMPKDQFWTCASCGACADSLEDSTLDNQGKDKECQCPAKKQKRIGNMMSCEVCGRLHHWQGNR